MCVAGNGERGEEENSLKYGTLKINYKLFA